jgi:hypothetical protein
MSYPHCASGTTEEQTKLDFIHWLDKNGHAPVMFAKPS